MLPPRIVEKPRLTVVGFEAPFIHALSPDATNLKVIPPLWDKLIQRAGQVPGRIDDGMYGIICGAPEMERAHPHELHYLAGVAVREVTDVPEGMVSRTVAAGTFAVFIHRGPIKTIGNTIREIYRIWLPPSGYRHADVADVELYDRRFCADSDDSEMEYWISVAPIEH